jgi:hypothetical protein
MQSKLSFLVINAPCLYMIAALNCIDPVKSAAAAAFGAPAARIL